MHTNNAIRAEEYYTLVGQKNVEGIKPFLHDEVEFYGPLSSHKGKKAVVEATSNFMKAFTILKIRTKFGAENQAMLIYDVDIPGIENNFPEASLLRFRDGLIDRIELFFDGSRFHEKR